MSATIIPFRVRPKAPKLCLAAEELAELLASRSGGSIERVRARIVDALGERALEQVPKT